MSFFIIFPNELRRRNLTDILDAFGVTPAIIKSALKLTSGIVNSFILLTALFILVTVSELSVFSSELFKN